VHAVGWLRAHGLLKSGGGAPHEWAMNR
jgi:hypothetical protein